jgi:hypothetical protein
MAERSVTSQLDQLLAGRDTCWYKGRLGKLNLVVVSSSTCRFLGVAHDVRRSCVLLKPTMVSMDP